MLPMLWLALVAPPVTLAQFPEPVLTPEVAQRLIDPPRCLLARCVNGEWQLASMVAIPGGQLRIDGQGLPGSGARLRLSDTRRGQFKPQGSNARVGLQYGMQAMHTDDASVRWVVNTGYRLQGYADDGTAGSGPILRGQVEWQQTLGARTKLTQTTRVETGQHGAFLRNSLLLKVQLHPALTLSSGVEIQRDSEIASRNQTDATVKLRYTF